MTNRTVPTTRAARPSNAGGHRARLGKAVLAAALVVLPSIVVTLSPGLSSPAQAAEGDLTGIWSGSPAGPWTSVTPIGLGVQAEATTPVGGAFAFTGTETLQPPFGGFTDYPFSADYVPTHESFAFTVTWPDETATGTLKFTFSEPVVNPILHLDRLGGLVNSVSNSASFELISGGTMTKLSGVDHLQVTDTTFVRTPDQALDPAATASCSDDATLGTACGSIQIAGTFTEVEFEWSGTGPTAAAADGIEFTWEITGVPEVSFDKTSDATAPLVDGDIVTYQIDVANIASTPIANIEIPDTLSPGLVYVPGSTTATFDATVRTETSLFVDTFDSLAPWNQDDNDDADDDVNLVNNGGSTRLRIRDNDAGAWRAIGDLSSYDEAIFTFDFRRFGLEDGDFIGVYAAADVTGVSTTNANCSTSAAWDQIGTIQRLQTTDPDYSTATFNLPAAYLTTNPGVCFFTPGFIDDNDNFVFDNTEVIGTTITTTTTVRDNDPDTAAAALVDGTTDPGLLISAADGITLASGNSITVTYQAVVDTSTLASGATVVNNDASFGAPGYPVPAPSASVTDTLAVADLSLTKADSGPVEPGGQVTYTIAVDNAGPTLAVDTVVTDTLGSGLTIDSVTPSQGSCTAFPCSLGDIAAGGSATITVVATVAASAPATGTLDTDANEPGLGDCVGADLCNVASVSSDSLDWDTTNNADDEPTDIIVPVIDVTKTAGMPVDNGDGTFDVDYTVIVANSGGAAGTYDLTDELDVATGITAVVTAGPTYDAGASNDASAEVPAALPAVITGGTIDPGAQDVVVYTIRYTVDPTAPVPDPCSDGAGSHAADNTATVSTGSSDTACVDLAIPRLELTKSLAGYTDVDTDGQISEGDELQFDFLVENTGSTTIDTIDLADANPLVTVTCPATTSGGAAYGNTLASGDSVPCTGTYDVTQVDVDAGSVQNTASVTATPDGGVLPPVPDSAVTTPINQSPSVQLSKANTSGTGPFLDGDSIDYEFVITNTGDVTLSGVTLSDPLLPGAVFTCAATLDPGDSTTCTATYFITQADLEGGQVANTATVIADSPLGVEVADTDQELIVLLQSPTLGLVKSHDAVPTVDADLSASITAGDTITFRFDVTNTGNVVLDTLVVDDPLTGPATCDDTTLAPGASTQCSVTYVVTDGDAADGQIENTATATAFSGAGAEAADSDSDVVAVAAPPSIAVSKGLVGINGAGSNRLDGWLVGDTLNYEFVVTNTGGVLLTSVTLADTVIDAADISCPVDVLAPGASTTCTGDYVVLQDDFDLGTITNTVTATGTTPGGEDFDDSATHVADTNAQTPAISIIKSVAGAAEAGGTLTYFFDVTNTGNVRLNGVAVTDTLLAAAPTCLTTNLDPGASTRCSGTYLVQPGDVEVGAVTNTATATGSPIGGLDDPSANDTLVTAIAQNPSIDLDKSSATTTDAAPVGVLSVGDVITYTLVVTNDGDVELTGVTFSDDLLGYTDAPVDTAPCDGVTDTLAPGGFVTCTDTLTVQQSDIDAGIITNDASATGTAGSGATPLATGSTSIVAAQNPGIQVTKALVGRADSDGSGNDSVGDVLTYDVVVTNTGNVTLDPASVSDARIGVDPAVTVDDASCVSEGVGTALQPGESATCTFDYVLLQPDVDAGSIANTATAFGQPPAGLDPVTDTGNAAATLQPDPALTLVKSLTNQSADPIVDGTVLTFGFEIENTGNVTLADVTVSDPVVGGPIACAATLAPGETASCSTTYDVDQDDVNAGEFENTATATGQPPTPVGGVAPAPVDSNASTVTTPIPQNSELEIVKTASIVPDPLVPGAEIQYTFTITNSGTVTVTDIEVDDSLIGVVPCLATLDPGVTDSCTANYEVTQTDVDAGQVVNSATASGTVPLGAPPLPPTPPSEVTTPIPSTPNWTFVKSLLSNSDADGSGGVTVDDVLTFAFDVENTGNVTITDIAVDDPLVGTVDCAVTTLLPGASTRCTGDYLVLQSDVDAGQVFNSATVSGTPPAASDPLPVLPPSEVTAPITTTPSLSLVKTLASSDDIDLDTYLATGDELTFSFEVTNTGDVTLSSVLVNDPLVGVVDCAETTLAPGASTTCTGVYAITQPNVDAGSVTNTASASAQPPTPAGGVAPPPVVSPDSSVTTPLTTVADIAVTKTFTQNADGDGSASVTAGDVLTFTIEIENTGTVTLDPVTYSDALVGDVDATCGVTSLAAGATTSCDVTYLVTQNDVDAGAVTNVVDADGVPPAVNGLTDVSDTDDVVVPVVQITELEFAKSSSVVDGDADGLTEPGDVVTYTFEATNTGTTVLSDVTITDPLPGLSALDCAPVQPAVLAPGGVLSCTATYSITPADVDAGRVDNTATAAGTAPATAPALDPITSTDFVPIDRVPSIDLTKAITGGPSDPGVDDVVEYTFTILNSGNVTLDPVSLTDAKLGLTAASCGATSLIAGTSTTCVVAYTVTQDDVDSGVIENVASATGTPPAGLDDVVDVDTLDQVLAQNPSITLAKSVVNNDDIADGQLSENDTLTYVFEIVNDGDVTLDVVTLTDALPGLGAISCTTALPATFDPGQSTTCTADYTVTVDDVTAGEVVNDALVTGNPPIGDPVRSDDQKIVTVTESPSIGLTKSAILPDPSPSVDDVVTYEFVVSNTGTVTLDSVSVSDTSLPGLSAIDCGGTTTLAIGDTLTCTATYTIQQADIDAGRIDNQASVTAVSPGGQDVEDHDDARIVPNQEPDVTLTKALASNADGDGSGSVTVDDVLTYGFTIENTGNVTLTSVSLSDARLGATDVDCGGVTTLEPGETTSCQLTYTVTQTDIDDGPIVNTATATATPPIGPDVESTDGETVVPPQQAALSIAKSVASNADEDTSASITVDDTLTYEFLVTNEGSVTLTDVVVTDPRVGTVDCPDTSGGVLPGADATCTATYQVTQADVDAGIIVNTATARATPPTDVASPTPATDTVNTPIARTPAMTVLKTSDASAVPSVDDIITYTFTVTNTGNVGLDPVVVVDPLPGLSAIDCGGTTALPVGGSVECTASYVVTQVDVDNGQIDNEVTVTATPPAGLAPLVRSDDLTVPIRPNPRIAITKTADPASDPAVDDVIEFTFVVTNPGSVTLDPVTVTDALAGVTAPACDASTLAPGDAITCSAFYTTLQSDVDAGGITNAASASGVAPDGFTTVRADDAVTVPIGTDPAIEIVKTFAANADEDASNSVSLDDTVTYRFDITNVGDVTLDPVDYTDELVGVSNLQCGALGALVPGATTTCTATYVVTQPDVDAGTIGNTASAAGLPPGGGVAVTDDDSVDVAVEQIATTTLTKSAVHDDVDGDSLVDVGEPIDYVLVFTNTGSVTLTDATVSDPLLTTLLCTPAAPATLAPGASMTCTGQYVVDQDDVDAGQVLNVATASATPPVSFGGVLPDASDDAVVPIDRVAAIDLVKTVVNNDADPVSLDDVLTYSFLIENQGNVTLTDVTLTDAFPFDAPITCAGGITLPATLDPGATITCSADATIQQSDVDAGVVANTASVAGDAPAGMDPVEDSETVTLLLPQNPSITLSKVATVADGTFDSDADIIEYVFVVENDGDVSLTLVNLSDALEGDAQFTGVDCTPVGLPTTLLPGETLDCTAEYDVEQDDLDAGQVMNTATAVGTPPGGLPPVESTDSAVVNAEGAPSINLTKSAIQPDPALVQTPDDDVSFALAISNDGNQTLTDVTIDDPLVFPGGPVALSALACTPVQLDDELAPGETVTCEIAYDVNQADIDAGQVRNRATVTGQPPTPLGGTQPPVVTDSDDELIVAPQRVGITVDKAFVESDDADGSGSVTALDTVTYSFEITNTGNVTLAEVTVADAKVGLDPAVLISTLLCDVDVSDNELAPGETAVCLVTYQVSQADVDAGEIVNDVDVAGTPPVGLAVSDSDIETVSPGQASAFTLDKVLASNADGDTSLTVSLDDVLGYEFVVVNTGVVTLTDLAITDDLGVAVTCLDTELGPGESVTCTAEYVVDQADVNAGEVVNTATAVASPPLGVPALDPVTDTVVTEVPQQSSISLSKVRTDGADPIVAGSTLTYTLAATNTGNVTLTGVELSDSLDATLDCTPAQPTTLLPGASISCAASYSALQSDVNAGRVVNTATVEATPPVTAPPLTPVDPVVVTTPIPATPSLVLVKSATPPTAVAAGDLLTYTFAVTNNGNVTLTDIRIDDARLGLVAYPCFFGPLQPMGTDSCTYDHEVTQDDIDAGQIVNVATSSGQPATPVGGPVPDRAVSPPSDVITPLPPDAAISIDKSSNVAGNPVVDQIITYSFAVSNTGNVTLDPVAVSDPMPGLSAVDCGGVTSLAPDASIVCTATYTVTQPDVDDGLIENTASVEGQPPTLPGGVVPPVVNDDDVESTVITAEPEITTAKSLEAYVSNGDGTYDVTFRITVGNAGNVTLADISVIDDIATQFADANVVAGTAQATDGSLIADATWDGTAATDVVQAGQSLAPLATGDVLVTFRIAPTIAQVLQNVVTSTGTPPGDVPLTPVPSPPVDVPIDVEVGSVSGVAFDDVDGDGVYTVGVDTPLADVSMTLTGTNAAGEDVDLVVTTGPDGGYVFDSLVPGDYVITEEQPPGYFDGPESVDSTVVAGTAGGSDEIAFTLGTDQDTRIDFAEVSPASLSGTVADSNGDPIEGVTVTLSGTDDLGNPVLVVVETDDNGAYVFTGLRPGEYSVVETTPDGYGVGTSTAGAGDGVSDGTVTGPDTIDTIVLASGEDATGYDFVDDIGSLDGRVYVDVDGDGLFTDGVDLPIEGVEVTLTGDDVNGALVPVTVTTAADGTYVFPSLLAGTYAITETQPEGYDDGADAVGSLGGDTTTNDQFSAITLSGGDVGTDYRFGEAPSGSVSGSVSDTAGRAIAGVEMTLTGLDVNGDPVTRVVATGADGSYVFDSLPPGEYTVTQTQPDGYGDGTSTAGSGGGTADVNVISSIVVGVTDDHVDYDFVEQLGSLSGTVFQDVDDDLVQADGEPGIGGVSVRLTGVDANGVDVDVTITTDTDGTYTFPDLVGGIYTVTETQPPQYQDGPDSVGTSGGDLVAPDSITGVQLEGDDDATGYVFSEVGQTIGGTVFIDRDRDGAIDVVDTGLAGVTITLLDADGDVVAETVTLADGTYRFAGLVAGDYTVVQTQPDGYGSTTSNRTDVVLAASSAGVVDFGESVSEIGGTVWADDDNDGRQGASEPGVQGVTVNLLDGDGAVIATTTTDADGSYLFGDILVGTYAVEVVPPAGQSLTEPGVGAEAGDSDPDWLTGVTTPVEIVVEDCPDDDCPLTPPVDLDAGLIDEVVDVSIVGAVSATTVAPGGGVEFRFVPGNVSTVPLPDGVEVVVTLPAGFTLRDVVAPGWAVVVDGTTITLVYPETLLPGEQPPPFSILSNAGSTPGSFDLPATITAIGFDVDPTPADNTDILELIVIPQTIPATGSDIALWLQIAVLLLAGGAVLLGVGRRRRDHGVAG